MKLVSTSYRWLWRTWYKNLKGYYWDIRNGIANIFIFFEAVWWFRAWNWDGLAHLIEVSAKQMRRVQEHGTHVGSDQYAKQLLIVQNLCHRLREDKYFENAEEGGVINKNLSAQHWQRMAEQDAEYLGKMFKFLQHWWE